MTFGVSEVSVRPGTRKAFRLSIVLRGYRLPAALDYVAVVVWYRFASRLLCGAFIEPVQFPFEPGELFYLVPHFFRPAGYGLRDIRAGGSPRS